MTHSVLLVDYENIGKIDLSAIPAGVRVPFFFGASQRTVPTEFLKAALRLGERFVPIDIEGQGKNALDFHIAFYLGEYLAQSPQTSCVILSKDKGFDPLVRHLSRRGFAVRRVNSVAEALGGATLPPAAAAAARRQRSSPDDVLSYLARMPRNRRPRKRKGLLANLNSHFSEKIPEAQLQSMIEQLIAQGRLSETGGAITYHF